MSVIGVITIREDEFEALDEHIRSFSTKTIKDDTKQHYCHYRFQNARGVEDDVFHCRSPQQGQTHAQKTATDLVEDINPDWILVVGIGGAMPDEDLCLGDVLIASNVLDFSVSAEAEDKRPTYAIQGYPVHPDARNLVSILPGLREALGDWFASIQLDVPPVNIIESRLYGPKEWKKKVKDCLTRKFPPNQTAQNPRFTAQSVASANILVKSSATGQRWLECSRQIKGVEMELAAVAHVGHNNYPSIPILGIRGISDVIGFDREGAWTKYACQSASAFTCALLRGGLLKRHQPFTQVGPTATIGPETTELGTKVHKAVCLSSRSLSWALANSVNQPSTLFLPRPFEYDALAQQWEFVSRYLETQDLARWEVREARRVLCPKDATSFRAVTQLDPLDQLVLSALVHELGADIEKTRIPPEQQINYSWRFSPQENGRLFDPNYNWSRFTKHCLRLARQHEFVLVADIADYFQRIPIEQLRLALLRGCEDRTKVESLVRILFHLSQDSGIGIPVGNGASRILAEAFIADLDHLVRAAGWSFCRYSDDFRFFANTRANCQKALSELAEHLHSYNLSLNAAKTLILTKAEYLKRFDISGPRKEIENLTERFQEFLEELGIEDPYEDLDYDNLSDEAQEKVDALNFAQIVADEASKSKPDGIIIRFALRRLGQLQEPSAIDAIFENLDNLGPSMGAVVDYLHTLRLAEKLDGHKVGAEILGWVLDESNTLSDYQRSCLMHVFSKDDFFDNETTLEQVYNQFNDPLTRRETILALGRSGNNLWFRRWWKIATSLDLWSRRALLAAASCTPATDRSVLYARFRDSGTISDIVEECVVNWAQSNPFGKGRQ